jgi:hypothetical protein
MLFRPQAFVVCESRHDGLFITPCHGVENRIRVLARNLRAPEVYEVRQLIPARTGVRLSTTARV